MVLWPGSIESGWKISSKGEMGDRASVAMEASEEELRRFCERRWKELDLLIIYLEG